MYTRYWKRRRLPPSRQFESCRFFIASQNFRNIGFDCGFLFFNWTMDIVKGPKFKNELLVIFILGAVVTGKIFYVFLQYITNDWVMSSSSYVHVTYRRLREWDENWWKREKSKDTEKLRGKSENLSTSSSLLRQSHNLNLWFSFVSILTPLCL